VRAWAGFRKFWKDFWRIVWEEDSLLSWTLNILLAFVLMKFIIYPGLGFVLDTSHPVVAVVSGSMEHQDMVFEQWYSSQRDFYMNYAIGKNGFEEFKFSDGIDTGDIIILTGIPPEDIKIGDVIVFNKGGPEPIIHRVVRKWIHEDEYYFETKGDANSGVNELDKNIHEDNVLGRAAVRIPYLGYVKIWFTNLIVCKINENAAICAAHG